MCSCSRGYSGAACKHQAAVAKAFNICSVNLAPYYSKEARKTFADLAMGGGGGGGSLWLQSFMQTCEVQAMQINSSEPADADKPEAIDSGGENISSSLGSTAEEMDYDGADSLTEQIENFRTSIREIEEDLVVRVREADHNFISGLCKFITTYRKMQKSSHAPTSTIAYALHTFGRPDSKSLIGRTTYISTTFKYAFHILIGIVRSQGRKGRYIKTNAGGIKRRHAGISKGSKMAPQGRPTKRKIGAQELPLPAGPKNLIASPTSLIIVDVSTLTFIGLGITLQLCQSSVVPLCQCFVCLLHARRRVVCLHLDAVSEWKGLMNACHGVSRISVFMCV